MIEKRDSTSNTEVPTTPGTSITVAKTEAAAPASAPAMDSVDGYTDEVEGEENKKSALFRGTRIKFSKTSEWEIAGKVMPRETRLILIEVIRLVTRWAYDDSGKKMPAEIVVLEPGERFPDVKQWNEQLPRSEWVKGFNGMEGP
jgi:hypothetical protein